MGLYRNSLVSHKRQIMSLKILYISLGLVAKQGRFKKSAVCLTLETWNCAATRTQGLRSVSRQHLTTSDAHAKPLPAMRHTERAPVLSSFSPAAES